MTGAERTWRLIAVADVLGFRKLLTVDSARSVADKYAHLLTTEAELKWEAKAVHFSDTFLIFGESLHEPADEDHDRFGYRFWIRHRCSAYLAWLTELFTDALFKGLPLRVGIAAGECVINERQHIYVGQPIVDAFITQEQQDWIGLAFHESVFSERRVGAPELLDRAVSYQVPTKTRTQLAWTVDWPNRATFARTPEGRARMLELLREGTRRQRTVRTKRKWQNTLAYYEERRAAGRETR